MSKEDSNYISETNHWEIYLNPDQYYLGRLVIVAKREVPAMSELTNEEWMDFAELARKTENGFKKEFEATMFNWTCLMNNAYKEEIPHPQVHWHMRPRYKNPVEFAGQTFEDKEFGHHYARETEMAVSSEIEKEIIARIQTFING